MSGTRPAGAGGRRALNCLIGLGGWAVGSLPPTTTYRHPVEWLVCRAKAATLLSHPALSDLLVALGSS